LGELKIATTGHEYDSGMNGLGNCGGTIVLLSFLPTTSKIFKKKKETPKGCGKQKYEKVGNNLGRCVWTKQKKEWAAPKHLN